MKLHHVLEYKDGTFHCCECGNIVTHHNLESMINQEKLFDVETN